MAITKLYLGKLQWVLSFTYICLFVAAALASPQQFSCENCGEEFESRIAAQAHKQYVCKRSEDTDSSHTSSVQLLQDLGNRYQTSSPFLNIKTERWVKFSCCCIGRKFVLVEMSWRFSGRTVHGFMPCLKDTLTREKKKLINCTFFTLTIYMHPQHQRLSLGVECYVYVMYSQQHDGYLHSTVILPIGFFLHLENELVCFYKANYSVPSFKKCSYHVCKVYPIIDISVQSISIENLFLLRHVYFIPVFSSVSLPIKT